MRKIRTFSYFLIISVLFLSLAFVLFNTFRIFQFSQESANESADAAIVLGGAVLQDQPSVEYEQRIKHSISLYQAGKVKQLIFTGKPGDDSNLAASQVAKLYALIEGVPSEVVLGDESSAVVGESLKNARKIMDQHGMGSALVVGDAIQMKRIIVMAKDLGIQAYSSPTPNSRRSPLMSQSKALAAETVGLINYYLQQLETSGYKSLGGKDGKTQASGG